MLMIATVVVLSSRIKQLEFIETGSVIRKNEYKIDGIRFIIMYK